MGLSINNLIEINKLEYVYQPLWNISDWRIYGYEGLLRFPVDKHFNPEELFQRARMEDCLFEMDMYSIKNSIENFPFFSINHQLLFLNIYPSTLLHSEFERFIQDLVSEHPYLSGRIVFELNESLDEYHIWKVPELKEKVSLIKNHGFYVALDDVGQGAATLHNIIEFKPNYIKLDKYFSKELASCQEKQAMISLLTEYCDENMILILEGIEKEIDLAQAILLNVQIAQGYLLGKPEPLADAISIR